MKVQNTVAKVIRVLTVPAVTSGCAMTVLWLSDTMIYRSMLDYLMVMLGLTVVPLLSYVVTGVIPSLRERGRETQRKYAMYFSAVGYVITFVYGIVSKATSAYMVIAGTYMVSIVLLLVLNKGMHYKASGHACSTVGPLVAMGYFLGGWYVVAGAAISVLVIWASMVSKQHRFWELMTGSAVSGLSFVCLAALI